MPLPPASDWLAEFSFELPDSAIARCPAEPRDASRLLVLDRASEQRVHACFRDLPRFLRAGDLLVLNETRVLRARIQTRLARTGRPTEVLLSHPEGESWIAMLGPGRRLRPGDRLTAEAMPGAALVLEGPEQAGLWRLHAEGPSVESWIEECGRVPLPPYMEREDTPEDRDWYQTVYAAKEGAVAAPTAGLHFTPELLAHCEAAGAEIATVVLHVGPGTFLPVRAPSAGEHSVLPERYEVPERTAQLVARTRAEGGRVIAVGTTTVRALETAAGTAAAGAAAGAAPGAASGSTATGAHTRIVAPGAGWAHLTILPGHRFRAVDALITNFHLPRSSLLLLVSALAGRERVLAAYAEARDAGFRFYSYGDAMLIV